MAASHKRVSGLQVAMQATLDQQSAAASGQAPTAVELQRVADIQPAGDVSLTGGTGCPTLLMHAHASRAASQVVKRSLCAEVTPQPPFQGLLSHQPSFDCRAGGSSSGGSSGGAVQQQPEVGVTQLLSSTATWAIIIVNIVNHFGYFIYLGKQTPSLACTGSCLGICRLPC